MKFGKTQLKLDEVWLKDMKSKQRTPTPYLQVMKLIKIHSQTSLQQEALDALSEQNEWSPDVSIMATGLGKTFLAA